jgi:hypothetical protein
MSTLADSKTEKFPVNFPVNSQEQGKPTPAKGPSE